MKTFSLAAAVLVLGLSMAVSDAEAAKRLGGGKTLGMQRQTTTQNAPTNNATPPTTSQAAPAANASAAAPAAGAATAANAGKRSWMGPLAGLAAGLGLAALASHFGFGEAMANMLMIGLLVMGVLMLVGFVMRKRAAASPMSRQGGLAYAGAGASAHTAGTATDAHDTQAMARTSTTAPAGNGGSLIGAGIGAGVGAGVGSNIGAGIGAGIGATPASQAWPADFDEAAFTRNAKVQFIRLQAVNDAGDVEGLRQFTTPEMFAELKMDLSERAAGTQHTDVTTIEAQVLDVAQEAHQWVVSVRFTGTIRESGEPQATPFAEVWHLCKPVAGSSGWLLCGIQQLA